MERPRLALLASLVLLLTEARYFDPDCSDSRHQQLVQCSVEQAPCDGPSPIDDAGDEQGVGRPHDLRVLPLAKAVPRRGRDQYQLAVDVSWQPPVDDSARRLSAFRLRIIPESGSTTCYIFSLSSTTTSDQKMIASSPRFRFSTEELFEFDLVYHLQLESLPKSANSTSSMISLSAKMPRHPASLNNKKENNTDAVDCEGRADPAASRWVAGFRRIFVHSLARTIQIEFVGAPPQYCFESYEVRLLDETGMELLHHAIISREAMKEEVVDNRTLLFGEHNFTGLELDKDYKPAVLPIERAHDGRCLCPVYADHRHTIDPYDTRLVCSCLAAEWKTVRLHKVSRPEVPCLNCRNQSMIMPTEKPPTATSYLWSVLLGAFVVCVLLALCVLLCFMLNIYRRYRAKGKTVRIRLIADRHAPPSEKPLVTPAGRRVLIVYSQDNMAHEAAVIALAEYLRDVCLLDVHLDKWELDELAKNELDYVVRSVLRADCVLLINSLGAHRRYEARAMHGERVLRTDPSPTDHLFMSHIDHVLQRPDLVVSTRFSYTEADHVLPGLKAQLQYVIPANLKALVGAMAGGNRFAAGVQLTKLNTAVERTANFQRENELWFSSSHCRVAIAVPIPISEDIEEPTISESPVQPLEPVSQEVNEEMIEEVEETSLPDDLRIDERMADSGIVSDDSALLVT